MKKNEREVIKGRNAKNTGKCDDVQFPHGKTG